MNDLYLLSNESDGYETDHTVVKGPQNQAVQYAKATGKWRKISPLTVIDLDEIDLPALIAAREEFNRLIAQRKELDARIGELERILR